MVAPLSQQSAAGRACVLLGLGIEQTWTAPLSASRDLLSVTSNGIECGL
jgi:hypothetical protein